MTLDFNPAFKHALELMETSDRHLFITGKAGTGKSTLLDYFCAHTDKHPVILAPTGVAALNVKGQTIHRFFNFYVDVTPQKIEAKDIKPRDPKLYKQLRTIIIDEVSMLRADLLDCIDVFLRMYGPRKNAAFGGVQMIFVGDLYQLPPVVGKEERGFFNQYYDTPYFFSAHVMQQTSLELVELEHVYRQKDEEFVHLLNKIRNNSVEDDDITLLNQRHQPDAQDDDAQEFTISLTTTNQAADDINDAHLDALKGKLYRSKARVKGEFGREYFPTATELTYKIGAQIMLLNNDQRNRWVNGSIGVIESRDTDDEGEEVLTVRLRDTNRLVTVAPYMWEVFTFSSEGGALLSKAAGSFTQFPFRLAWAVTIHKSQGKTFDKVIIDIGRGTFASGQTYVALSRCTSFEGITLKVPIRAQHIRTDPRIYKFLTAHAYRKAEMAQSFEDKLRIIEEAIKHQSSLHMTYLKANDSKSQRVIIPVSLAEENYQGKIFPGMRAFCTQRKAERMFHVGRILALEPVVEIA